LLLIFLLVLGHVVRLCRLWLCCVLCCVLLRRVRLRCVLRISSAGNTQERCERQGPKQLFHTSSSAMIVQVVRCNLCWKETAPPGNQRFPVSGARRYPPLQRQDCRLAPDQWDSKQSFWMAKVLTLHYRNAHVPSFCGQKSAGYSGKDLL